MTGPVGGMSDGDRAAYERLRPIFDAAIELPPERRAAHVSTACAGDADLERRVLRLIAVADGLCEAMESPLPTERRGIGEAEDGAATSAGHDAAVDADGAESSPRSHDRDGAGTRIGPYTIVERLGEGGFGSVFRAEQREPMRREVAIKIIRAGMDSEQVIARFRAEAQALAMMESPHIAKVIEAGTTSTGRPYFVMELVRGEPITRYCDANALTIRQRLELFQQVCEAVQHAHHKGVFHRDLKPTNVLAFTLDGRPFAVVIDFGIAKAVAATHDDAPDATQQGQPIGTPGYMSPEQVRGSLDIDARTDVYSLGVLLYELITGATPLEWAGLRSAPIDEVRRFICEVDPPRPSTRLGGGDAAARLAEGRSTAATRLALSVRGDLDWIVLKAMAANRAERYASASELAADIGRHLRDAPVLAGAPSASYVLRKFARRHRAAVLGVAAAVAALLVGLVGTTAGLVKARHATAQAQRREAETRAIADFQAHMLEGIDAQRSGMNLVDEIVARHETALRRQPLDETDRRRRMEALHQELLAINATDVAVAMIDRAILAPAVAALADPEALGPTTTAQLRHTLAGAYADLGRPDEAMRLRLEALETRRRELGDDHPDTLTTIDDVGLWRLRGGDAAGAEPLLREALDRRRRVLGADHRDALRSWANLGAALLEQRRLDDAAEAILGALEGRRATLGDDDRDTIDSMQSAGQLALARGDFAEAERRFDEAMRRAQQAFGVDHALSMGLYASVATQLMRQGRYAQSEQYVRASLEASRRVLGDDHPVTVKRLGNLGAMLSLEDKLDEAETCCREALVRLRALRGDTHPETVGALSNLARVVQLRGRLDEAAPLHVAAMDGARRIWGDDDPRTIALISNVGASLMTRGRLIESAPYVQEALERRRRVLPEDHPDTLAAIAILGVQLEQQGDLDAARTLQREALEKRRRVLGAAHPDTLHSMQLLGALLREVGEPVEAEAILREALATRRREHPDDTADAAGDMEALGALLREQGRLDEAREFLEQSLALRRPVLSDDHPDTLVSMRSLALLRRDAGDLAEAERLLRDADERWRRTLGEEHPGALEISLNLASVLRAQERVDEAQTLLERTLAIAERSLPPRHRLLERLRASVKSIDP